MDCIRGFGPLCYRRLGLAEWDVLASLELDPQQVERFLGPTEDILAAVRAGPAHSLIAIEVAAQTVGFYVVHPDARDRACWWLGWIAVDHRQQGRGLGRLTVMAALARLRRLPGCRRARLLVAPDNRVAMHLYEQAGFRAMGRLPSTGELILELVFGAAGGVQRRLSAVLLAVAAHSRRVFRHWRLRLIAGPHAAWVIGVERGPPPARHICINPWARSCSFGQTAD